MVGECVAVIKPGDKCPKTDGVKSETGQHRFLIDNFSYCCHKESEQNSMTNHLLVQIMAMQMKFQMNIKVCWNYSH